MKLKLIGFRDHKFGYEHPGYYIRVSRNLITQDDFNAIKIWCSIREGTIIDHNTLFFTKIETAKDFVEMFS